MFAKLTLLAVCYASGKKSCWPSRLCKVHADVETGLAVGSRIQRLTQRRPYHALAGLLPEFHLINEFLGAGEIIRLVVSHISSYERCICWPISVDACVNHFFRRVRPRDRRRFSNLLSPLPVALIDFGREFRLHPDCQEAVLAVKDVINDFVQPRGPARIDIGLGAMIISGSLFILCILPRNFH